MSPLPVSEDERRRQYPFVDEAEERLGVSRFTLREWRKRGYGPEWTKIARRVVYPLQAVTEFEESLFAQAAERQGKA